jgi:hypothetical protein
MLGSTKQEDCAWNVMKASLPPCLFVALAQNVLMVLENAHIFNVVMLWWLYANVVVAGNSFTKNVAVGRMK